MSLIALPFAHYKRALLAACVTAALPYVPALGQGTTPAVPPPPASGAPASAASAATQPAAPPAKPGAPIQHIVVAGAQRIEPATVLSYISLREGEAYDEGAV